MGCAISSLAPPKGAPLSRAHHDMDEELSDDARGGKKARRSFDDENVKDAQKNRVGEENVSLRGIGLGLMSPPFASPPRNDRDVVGEGVSLASHGITHLGYGGLKKENQVRVSPLHRAMVPL